MIRKAVHRGKGMFMMTLMSILKGTSVSVGFHATVTKARARFAAKQLSYRKVRIKRNFKEEGH